MNELSAWLQKGGDHRQIVNELSGRSPYRVTGVPGSNLPLGSCTASSPGPRAWNAAMACMRRWKKEGADSDAAEAIAQDIRDELRRVMELPDGVTLALAPSGTDVLYLVSHLALKGMDSVHHVVVGANELGGGTVLASAGKTFSPGSPFGEKAEKGAPISGMSERCSAEPVYMRRASGERIPSAEIDAVVLDRVGAAVREGRRVVLHMVVHSKTGLRAPSLPVAQQIKSLYGDQVIVLVDAAQGRLAPADIRRALREGFLVLFTGSKFYSGPPFSGVLLIPEELAEDPGPMPESLSLWFDRASMPTGWPELRGSLAEQANPGLLFRWCGALGEFTAYHAVEPQQRAGVYMTFAGAVHEAFGPCDRVELEFPLPPIHPLVTALGAFPTVFGMRIRSEEGWLGIEALRNLHAQLDTAFPDLDEDLAKAYYLGQPVPLGFPGSGGQVYLRIALGARLVTDLAHQTDAGGEWMRQTMLGLRRKLEYLLEVRP